MAGTNFLGGRAAAVFAAVTGLDGPIRDFRQRFPSEVSGFEHAIHRFADFALNVRIFIEILAARHHHQRLPIDHTLQQGRIEGFEGQRPQIVGQRIGRLA